MAIKINLMPKKEDTAVRNRQQQSFYFFVIVIFFIISLLGYLGIYYYNNILLKKQLEVVEKKNAEIQEEILRSATAEEFSTMTAAIVKGNNIRLILSTRLYVSMIYELLEKLTLKSILYNKFSEKNNDDNTIVVSIEGEADNFNELAKQLVIFKNSKEIKEVIFSEAVVDKNSKVVFLFVLKLDSKTIFATATETVNAVSP